MFKMIKMEVAVIDPIRAEILLKNNKYNNRNIRNDWINVLCRIMQDGLFVGGDISVGVFDGESHLVNGQHQLNCIIKTGLSQRVVYKTFQCEKESDLSLLFRCFDSHYSRSLNDKVRIEKESLEIDVPDRIVSVVNTAMSIKHGIFKKSFNHHDRVRLVGQYRDEAEFIHLLMGGGRRFHHMLRGSVVKVIIDTYHINPDDSYKFWTKVGSGANLNEKDPRLVLRNYLLSGDVIGAGNSTDREVMYKCTIAWNRWRSGSDVSILKYTPNFKMPKAA